MNMNMSVDRWLFCLFPLIAGIAFAAAGGDEAPLFQRYPAYADLSWTTNDPVSMPRDKLGDYYAILERAGKQREELLGKEDVAGLQALGRELGTNACRFLGQEAAQMEFYGRNYHLDGDTLAGTLLERRGRPWTVPETVAVARGFMEIGFAAEYPNVQQYLEFWWCETCVNAEDPYGFDLELAQHGLFAVLAEARGRQASIWRADERLLEAGKDLPKFRHEFADGKIVEDDNQPVKPYPELKRAWEREYRRLTRAAGGSGQVVMSIGSSVPSADWYELRWDVDARQWRRLTTLEELQRKDVALLGQLASFDRGLSEEYYKLYSLKEKFMDEFKFIESQRKIPGRESSWQKRLVNLETIRQDARKHAATMEALRDKIPGLLKDWEANHGRLLAVRTEEARILGRNYQVYCPAQPKPDRDETHVEKDE